MNSEMSKLVEKNIVSRKNILVLALALALFLFMASGSIYRYMKGYGVSPFEVGSMLIIIFALLERAQGRYEYEADTRCLKFRKRGWLGAKDYEISYRDIIGIYEYKAKLIGYLKFRRTLRLNSALDGRMMWVIAYKVGVSGKPEHYERIYFKPSDEMLQYLSGRMPGKVKVPETQVVVDAFRSEEETKSK
ncbi:MAG TPA: hypothetical protein VN631_08080 [Negativicutes bacterium]|nr:hypothetical protein [Negativicutes bacterium]